MTVRAATEADLPAIGALWNAAIRDTLITFESVEKSPEALAELLAARRAAGHGLLVLDGPGGVAGFAGYGQFRAGTGYRHAAEHSILLAPDARGRGAGRRLMAALEAHARGAGMHSLVAGVSGANPEGQAFHAALGFAEVAVLREVGFKAGRWLDLHLMQKML